MPIAEHNTRTIITLHKDVYREGRKIAEKDQRSFSNWVSTLIQREVRKEKESQKG